MSLKAVLFDLDNTLIDRNRALRKALLLDFPRDQVERLYQLPHQSLLKTWGLTQNQLVERLCQYIQPSPCLLEWLHHLQRRHQLGLVSNGGSSSQRLKLKVSQLDQVFSPENIFISGEMGVAKPDPEIFRRALAQMQQSPHQSLYLGDQLEVDGLSARAAGLRFIHVLRPLSG